MSLDEFIRINRIVEQDATDSTYKFALLRGVIQVCQENSAIRREEGGKVWFPLGLLMEKWLLYYYPIIANHEFIPQKTSETSAQEKMKRLSFRSDFEKITDHYERRGGLSVLYSEYRQGIIPDSIRLDFLTLLRRLRSAITQMPMRHLGWSINHRPYGIFGYVTGRTIPRARSLDRDAVIEGFGSFSMDRDLYEVFSLLGGFITGENSLLYRWAEFTASVDTTRRIGREKVLEILSTWPETERDVYDSRRVYERLLEDQSELECVWTGNKIKSKETLAIDHVIPFSVWMNNDLWNLMPTLEKVNTEKGDRVPSPEALDKRRECILRYWKEVRRDLGERFDKEIRLSLVGMNSFSENTEELAFERVKEQCQYLIEKRGLQPWSP